MSLLLIVGEPWGVAIKEMLGTYLGWGTWQDMNAVFLSGKVEQLHSAVLANYGRSRQQSAVLEEVQQAALGIVKRINEHRVKLCREQVESIRQFQKMMRQEARRRGKFTSPWLAPPVLCPLLTIAHPYRLRQFEAQLD